ncbi:MULTISPECIES: hypothetical protein [unclassified Spiroplasma]|uniref:hypothetical protein n=1 Tax=unclassified Spiroplasma TaxID=2637901 RepID=UPI00207A49B3|nr:hypothetical protein [Spiroplasma endosymbiont of Lariophagus distinguendus]
MNNYQLLKSSWKWFNNKYLMQTILWILLTICLIICAILWEVKSSIFNKILTFDFFNNASITDETIITLKTYLYIAIFSSCIASNTLIFIQIRCWMKKYIENKYKVISNFENNFFIFKALLVLNVARNITYIFCFTNVFTTLFVLTYWFCYFIIYIILEKILEEKNQILGNPWWKDIEKRSLFIILGFEVLYLIVKNSILNFTKGTINIDQVLKYFIPASSLALILAVFIQSLVKNDVKTILNNIKNVKTKVDDFKIFYNWDYKNIISDFLFVKEAPLIIRNELKQKVLTNEEKNKIFELLHEIYQFLIFVEKQNIKVSELKYIYYHLFYEITNRDEISQIKNRIINTKKKNLKIILKK